ncbi:MULTISPECIES: substrate-binding domain-containing protein [Ramlibacter]|uniref:Helix-turn-helix transcriptional regulator n=1 Tax=Ramlibacter aquaticus TaxID=2780094 RepID=A0ABR9SER3_9BURK|nr:MULTISPECIES: substrate-binding domain-containing protein [Ramlibacter]MBE7940842.1 helix-turn-helix transcriptional regulator [Ramlibacter aquaticus]
MRRVEFAYRLNEGPAGPPGLGHPLVDLLQAVQEGGSIVAAAGRLGVSYRHAWGQLKRWEVELGQPLVGWSQGEAARLSPFATKLLWAERQAQARIAPQLEAVRGELERAFALAFDPQVQVLTLFASHDEAVSALRGHAGGAGLQLDMRFVGSVDAISALNEGRCVVAGFHTPAQPAPGSLAQRTYQPLLEPGRHKLIGFARRWQGLAVAPGNPLGLGSVVDIARQRARFVPRALGTGTRLLFEEMLQAAGILPDSIRGLQAPEPSHAAVAQAVASGAADVGLCIEPAARALGLGFVPLLEEHYHLACLKDALDEPPVASLRRVLRSRGWRDRIAGLPGYTPSRSGQVLSLRRELPWWRFEAPPPRRALRPRRSGSR